MIPSIPADKANHAVYGGLIGLGVYAAALVFMPILKAALMAFVVSALVGAAKEWLDYRANVKANAPVHGVEWLDFVATAAGGLVVALAAALSTLKS